MKIQVQKPSKVINVSGLVSTLSKQQQEKLFTVAEVIKAFEEVMDSKKIDEAVEKAVYKAMSRDEIDEELERLSQEEGVEASVVKANNQTGGDLPELPPMPDLGLDMDEEEEEEEE